MQSIEKALSILAGTPTSGTTFFQRAAEALAVGLGCRWAGIVRLSEDRAICETLAAIADGRPSEPLSYPLAGTPCAEIYGSADATATRCFYPSGLASRFPDDRPLANLGAESCRGEAILNAAGAVVGHVYVMDDEPLGTMPNLARSSAWLVSGSAPNTIAGKQRKPSKRVRPGSSMRPQSRALDPGPGTRSKTARSIIPKK